MDIACVSCGYNLRGLSPDGRCPECGTAIGRSTRGDYLRFCDPGWVETLASGMNWIVAGLILAFVLGLFAGGVAGLTNKPAYGMLGLVGSLVTLIGYWKVTTPDPREAEPQGVDVRAVIRYGSALNIVLAVASQIVTQMSLYWTLLAFPSAVVGLMVTVSIFVYAKRMALRIPDDSLASQTRIVMWGFVIMSVLGMLFLAATMALGTAFTTMIAPAPGTGGAGGPGTGGTGASVPGGLILFGTLGCVTAVVSLVFSIWALVLLVRYRRAFIQAARDARATWAVEPAGQQGMGLRYATGESEQMQASRGRWCQVDTLPHRRRARHLTTIARAPAPANRLFVMAVAVRSLDSLTRP
jgi:hypothetical protein